MYEKKKNLSFRSVITQNTSFMVMFSVITRNSNKHVGARKHFKKTHILLEGGLLKDSLTDEDISADSTSKPNDKLISCRWPKTMAYSLPGIFRSWILVLHMV